jgi:hypothetical protein
VRYKLVSIFARNGLWAHRNDPATFAKPGNFAGDKSGGCGEGITVVCQVDAANAPWGWDDHDDGPVGRGDIATDPVRLVKHYFSNLGEFSEHYVRNPYR